ncbi:MAG: alpha-D-glucose phosphate-specific phosphoglucomutase [Cardiobacteriaceae bacterium]|nr:alpha-D-glucose phosphate-specific phosphoglucomutase [Cardiobacteriaceae bacterium]
MQIQTIAFPPFDDQRPGTSGLRKTVRHYQQPHYAESFLQAIFNTLGIAGKTVVVGGDGRYFNDSVIQTLIRMAAAQGAARLIVGENGLLSTPATSHIIRHYQADYGIILSASHNPGGQDGDFGIKFNLAAGQPAPESVTEAVYAETQRLGEYRIADIAAPALAIGEHQLGDTCLSVISSTADYVEMLAGLFDFDAIRAYLRDHKLLFDAMHAVTGPYAKALLHATLGLEEKYLLNTQPQPDFGGGHPDPAPDTAKALQKRMQDDPAIVMGAASDGDGDRNMVCGRTHLINPCDSLAIIADRHTAIPALRNLKGVGRTMPTSRAIDLVTAKHGLTCYETPTGWKFFGNLLEAGHIQLCGEESFGTSGDHIREKDGLWAVMCWLSILAASGKTPDAILEEHWQTYGRHHFNRFDYENLDKPQAEAMLAAFEKDLGKMLGQSWHGLAITNAGQFRYTDPTNGEQTGNQGLQIQFGRQARIITRLSGTSSSGATLRIYCEYWQQDISKPAALPGTTATLAAFAQGAMNIAEHCGRHQPDHIV